MKNSRTEASNSQDNNGMKVDTRFIFILYSEGYTCRQIAREMGISPSTVSKAIHREGITNVGELRKMGKERIDRAFKILENIAFNQKETAPNRIKAIGQMIPLMERESKLLGLDRPQPANNPTHSVDLGDHLLYGDEPMTEEEAIEARESLESEQFADGMFT